MSSPTDRTSLKTYAMTACGQGVINVDVSDDQLEDRLDDALKMFREFHHAGMDRGFYTYQLQPVDLTNEYITLPVNIIEVVRILPYNNTYSAALFSALHYAKYMFMYSYNFGVQAGQIYPYAIAMSNLEQLDEQIGQKIGYSYNRYDDKLYIQTDWSLMEAGYYLVMEVYSTQDIPGMYGDIWLDRYYTALVKKQWGTNLSKYNGVVLLGNVTYAGHEILAQAESEIEKLERQLHTHFSLPAIGTIA